MVLNNEIKTTSVWFSETSTTATEEIDFDPMLIKETIERVQIFFKLVVAPELLHSKLKNKTELTGSSSDGLVPAATESDTTVTEEPVVSSAVDYMCLLCHKVWLDEPVNFNDTSVCCDFCEQLFHWVYVRR